MLGSGTFTVTRLTSFDSFGCGVAGGQPVPGRLLRRPRRLPGARHRASRLGRHRAVRRRVHDRLPRRQPPNRGNRGRHVRHPRSDQLRHPRQRSEPVRSQARAIGAASPIAGRSTEARRAPAIGRRRGARGEPPCHVESSATDPAHSFARHHGRRDRARLDRHEGGPLDQAFRDSRIGRGPRIPARCPLSPPLTVSGTIARDRNQVLPRRSQATRNSPLGRPAARSGRPSPRPLRPKPWFRSRAGTLTRPAPASVAHPHSEDCGSLGRNRKRRACRQSRDRRRRRPSVAATRLTR